jgi:signal transduction histidine kinase
MNTTATPSSVTLRQRLWPWVLPLLTALTGLALTVYARTQVRAQEDTEALEQFSAIAATVRKNTEREIGLFQDVLDSIRALHGISGAIRPDAFEEFVDKGMVHQREVLTGFGFAQRITHNLRQALERTHREAPQTGYRIVQDGVDTSYWPDADARPLYFPLTWQNADQALHVPIGFDFGARPAARRAILRMEQGDQQALVLDPANRHQPDSRDHWVLTPIWHQAPQATQTPALVGFAVALLNPERLLERAAAAAPVRDWNLSMTPTVDWGETATDLRQEGDRLVMQERLMVVDLPWLFRCEAPAVISRRRSTAIGWGGLIITALVSSQLLLLANRARRIERTVQARTADLHQAKQQLETEMEERARLEEEISDTAARERQRLGRDLHDSLGQKLTGAVFLSRSLLKHLTAQNDTEATHATTLNKTLKEAVGQVRSMARGLAPVTLNDESLAAALRELTDEMTELYGVSCEVEEPLSDAVLDERTKEALYFIAREAINNAARHAQPKRVTLRLREQDGRLMLRVKDDGKGLPPNADKAGMGLRIMQYRAAKIGATWQVRSEAGGGTQIEVEQQVS